MFKRSFGSKDRATKATKPTKRSFAKYSQDRLMEELDKPSGDKKPPPGLKSAIVTIVVGRDGRLFAAHEDILSRSPFFKVACKERFYAANPSHILLPDEEPETFSCILEFLYKGDYSPRILHDKKRNAWYLEDVQTPTSPQSTSSGRGRPNSSTMFHSGVGDYILRDTAVYCSAGRYGLEELQRLALRKQGLQSGIQVQVILRSMRYCYENTPDTDSRLRAHYLALVVRSRKTFKASGTMQMEMETGGRMFFDLFVAMCNHMDDLQQGSWTPKTV